MGRFLRVLCRMDGKRIDGQIGNMTGNEHYTLEDFIKGLRFFGGLLSMDEHYSLH